MEEDVNTTIEAQAVNLQLQNQSKMATLSSEKCGAVEVSPLGANQGDKEMTPYDVINSQESDYR